MKVNLQIGSFLKLNQEASNEYKHIITMYT